MDRQGQRRDELQSRFLICLRPLGRPRPGGAAGHGLCCRGGGGDALAHLGPSSRSSKAWIVGGVAMERQGQRRSELRAQLIERATRDQAFRQELVRDPKGVIQRELSVEIPPGVDIRVVEESPTTSYLVLPPAPVASGQQLSDRDLEAVAGGWSAWTDCGSCDACVVG